eukprot:8325741-Ditylum_brightwellii.AAC.1
MITGYELDKQMPIMDIYFAHDDTVDVVVAVAADFVLSVSSSKVPRAKILDQESTLPTMSLSGMDAEDESTMYESSKVTVQQINNETMQQ